MTVSESSVDVVARVLAVLNFGLSLIGFGYLALKDRRRVKVKAENARQVRGVDDLGSVLSVSVVNTGHRPITITGIGLDFSEGDMLANGAVYTADSDGLHGIIERSADSDSLPTLLEDGGVAQVKFDYNRNGQFMAELDEGAKLDGIYAYDAENEKHKAKVPKYLRDRINKLGESDDGDTS